MEELGEEDIPGGGGQVEDFWRWDQFSCPFRDLCRDADLELIAGFLWFPFGDFFEFESCLKFLLFKFQISN